MKVVQINATCGVGSTGKICVSIAQLLDQNNIENCVLYSIKHGVENEKKYGKSYSNLFYTKLYAFGAYIFGNQGFNARLITKRLIRMLDKEAPDIVHLHNLHSHNCDLEMLFSYFKQKKIRLIWTFHDCWAFTGYCPYFSAAECDKWLRGCCDCILRKSYSCFFDKSAKLYAKKKKSFSDLDLTIVTPSKWLAEFVEKSFLGSYETKVINNGINLSVFKPAPSDFRKEYGIEEKFIVLGVCFDWHHNKGVDVFIDLAEKLSDEYAIVLVGSNKDMGVSLPERIISIERTKDQRRLAEIYTACDVFLNPTREDNFPTVNLEALACGTPVITFNTGGSPEAIDDTCGMTVDCDVDSMLDAIEYVKKEHPFDQEACLRRAALFDDNKRFKEYLDLYLKNER